MRTFGELEAAVMQVVWSHGEPVTVRAIADELNETRPLAYTTISTITERLRAKGRARQGFGRPFLPVRRCAVRRGATQLSCLARH